MRSAEAMVSADRRNGLCHAQTRAHRQGYPLRGTSETALISMDLCQQIWEQTSLDYQQRDDIYMNSLKFRKDSTVTSIMSLRNLKLDT